MELNNKKILIGLSGGINSAAVLCWLIDSGIKPKQLHLYYAHFAEHAPDTFQFVADLIRYARVSMDCPVVVKITSNSVIKFFQQQKMIPHPAVSPCSRKLKIEPINKYAFDNQIDIDLIGYVKEEFKRRSGKQVKPQLSLFDAEKFYPIGDQPNEWCFEYVKQHIGWYPDIYEIRDTNGNRLFKHNNCLPCKNMYPEEIALVEKFFPDYYLKAMQLSAFLGSFWGRNEAEFYTTFGRMLGQESTCETCKI